MIKAALVLQGGGMRSVYTSGVLDALMENNIFFEAVYGVSAGAKNSQYYLSKQIGEAIKVDLFCATNKKAISFRNLIFEGGVISADYYNDYIMKEYAPLNDDFYKSEIDYNIGATNCLTGEIKYFKRDEVNVRDSVTASCSIPLVQKIKFIDDIPYLDGGIASSIPIDGALNDGYDIIIAVMTREREYQAGNDNDDKLQPLYKIKYRQYPQLVNKLLTMNSRHNELLSIIRQKEKEGKCFSIYPSKKPDIGMLEHDQTKLFNLYKLGKEDLNNSLDKLNEFLKKNNLI